MSCQERGWHRRRHGRGFAYRDAAGNPLPEHDMQRIKDLAIPPAWTEVWICPHPRGHLQAVGTDEAGRRQYLYHAEWRRKQDELKFDRVVGVGRALPRVRPRLRQALQGEPTTLDTVLAAAIRLVDLGCFRLGADSYTEENGSFGLTTLENRHVRRKGDHRLFCFVGKSGVEHEIVIDDPAVVRVTDALARNRPASARLLSAREGRRRRPIEPSEVNDRIRDLFGSDVTAKDLRTWKATATVAAELAGVERSTTRSGRSRQVRAAIEAAADLLGNTPTVARSSYVDPRVIDLFEDGRVIAEARSEDDLDRAVAQLLLNA